MNWGWGHIHSVHSSNKSTLSQQRMCLCHLQQKSTYLFNREKGYCRPDRPSQTPYLNYNFNRYVLVHLHSQYHSLKMENQVIASFTQWHFFSTNYVSSARKSGKTQLPSQENSLPLLYLSPCTYTYAAGGISTFKSSSIHY